MTIQRGDYVRPNNLSSGLPQGSVWRVACSAGALKIDAGNEIARSVPLDATAGCRFPALDFDKVVLCRGQWVAVNEVDSQTNAVANAEDDLANAANATAAIEALLEATRKLKAQRKAELQAAKLAKAKADKEAAAKAKVEEAKRQLSARLHADRCLGEATLALIAEVSRLNNGGSEQVAHSSIANHVDQLQPLAKSYGYRIAKPSMLAQVVKI